MLLYILFIFCFGVLHLKSKHLLHSYNIVLYLNFPCVLYLKTSYHSGLKTQPDCNPFISIKPSILIDRSRRHHYPKPFITLLHVRLHKRLSLTLKSKCRFLNNFLHHHLITIIPIAAVHFYDRVSASIIPIITFILQSSSGAKLTFSSSQMQYA